jgi:indolepyruvate ferredoxin oxidoreductase
MRRVFGMLAKFKFLRGTIFDPFSYSEDRKLERNLIKGYEQDVVTVMRLLSPRAASIAAELLSLPDQIRGYGPVKEASVAAVKARYERLARELADPPPISAPQIAAE